ncbi:type IV pilus secretin PilQ [Exilibacterium tricleocarpae]|uniref:Type IV pilus secretin PilQ n=1 Tax=Exilibacterium tricleocarpae TaxID=2591008 RepID=A0A545T609_9GAMM|nr:type IV pilus secretin PilQ family protein [Exilibacterium tricleocarpae]TQV72653.1 type IV pilus secretin PilQ [Exilibacterium tricleocarpae]
MSALFRSARAVLGLIGWGCVCALVPSSLWAANLEDISFAELPGERFEVRMEFSEAPATPAGYTIEQPARIVLDFPNVENLLKEKKYPLSFGNAKSAVVLSGGGRTRLILNLGELTQYQTRSEGNAFFVEVGTTQIADYVQGSQSVAPSVTSTTTGTSTVRDRGALSISNIDFRRGEDGEGKVIVTLSDPSVNVDVEDLASGIELSFINTLLPEELRRRLDVTDFATPVTFVSSDYDGSSTVIKITPTGDYDYLAYQADNQYVISVKPLSDEELEEKRSKFAFVGEKLSLNFQDIEVRSVLQLIADFTELNLVASDTVSGRITLRLDNVPWDQALDLVLKTKGLDKRQVGNVLMVAPAVEIAERERQELETKKQLEELAPLRTEYIRIRYANARELFKLFTQQEGGFGGGADSGTSTGSILSERGQAIVDERTNSIILTDTEEKILEFVELVEKIDVPIRQVEIEARIVIATTNFREELGIRLFGDGISVQNGNLFEFTGSLAGLSELGPAGLFTDNDGDGIADQERNLDNSTIIDLGTLQNPAGAFTWNLRTDDTLIGMELSALEDTGNAEIVSQPKVITGDKQQATIESGTEIPFQEASASGATSTSFKEAVLKLDVTPQITPDNRIIMDLQINQDAVGEIDLASGIPTINVTEIATQVLVGNGQTVVLGGIYRTEEFLGETKVPVLGDIPYIGRIFRRDINTHEKRELLIFITPRILVESRAN